MKEVLAVAHASLADSAPASASAVLHQRVAEDIINHENPASTFKPSMLVDLEAGRPIELEAIVGGILKRARANHIDVPRLTFIYAGLRVIQAALTQQYKSTM